MLHVIRSQIAPDDAALKEARSRRDAARAAAESFGSTNRSFASGSIAHRTANCPIHHRDVGLDADCGVVLDRRAYPTLGPDSASQVGPFDVVTQMARHLERRLEPYYPRLKVEVTTRAILLTFNEPLPGGEDPTVDIVVGLDRVGKPACGSPTPRPTPGTPHTRRSTPNSSPPSPPPCAWSVSTRSASPRPRTSASPSPCSARSTSRHSARCSSSPG